MEGMMKAFHDLIAVRYIGRMSRRLRNELRCQRGSAVFK